MLRVTVQSGTESTVFRLEGKLAGDWVEVLRRVWSAHQPLSDSPSLVLDLSDVDFIDERGKGLLAELHVQGAALIPGAGPLTRAIVHDVQARTTRQPRATTVAGAVCLFLLSMFLPANVWADEGAKRVTLTLGEAIKLALRQNPIVHIATLNLASSQQERNAVRADLLPTIGGEVSESVTRGNSETLLGRRVPLFPREVGPFQTFQGGVGFSVPIFDLTLWRRYQAAGAVVKANDAARRSTREQVALLVTSQYLGALRAAAEMKAAQSRVELATALHRQAADLQEHGVGTGLDTLRANVRLQAEKQRLLVASTQYTTANYGLTRLLNLDPHQEVELADSLKFFDLPSIRLDEELARAYAVRPEMTALEARAQAAANARSAAGESRLPSVHAEGSWGYQGLGVNSAIPAYQYDVSVRLPLFTGGKIRAETTKADLELKKIEQQKQELRNAIALEVKTAVAVLEAARNEVEVANLALSLAQEEVQQARDRFEAGVANNIEVITAQDGLERANDNQISALYRYNQARADLARATGQIEALFAK